MPKTRAGTLSALVCLLVERFLPEAQQSYVLPNLRSSEWFRRYNDFVPEFLRGRPRSVILHCLERQSRSSKYHNNDVKVGEREGVFTVQKTDGSQYVVDYGRRSPQQMPSCSCKDWTRWHIPCKHFFAVFHFQPAWNWEALPQTYRDSAYLSTDSDATDAYFSQFSGVSHGNEDAPSVSSGVEDVPGVLQAAENTVGPLVEDELDSPASPESPVPALRQQIPVKVRKRSIHKYMYNFSNTLAFHI